MADETSASMKTAVTTSTVHLRDVGPIVLRHQGTPSSLAIARAIVAGRTYPAVPFIREVTTALDVGANIGAATIYLAALYPSARVCALEPAAGAFALLEDNTRNWPNVVRFRHGLGCTDRRAMLYDGAHESVEASLYHSVRSAHDGETVDIRAPAGFLAEQGIEVVDVLKLDVEGCEVEVLQSLGSRVQAMKVLYVEYHSERDRRLIDEHLAASHVLWRASVTLVHRGEFCYVRRDLVPREYTDISPELIPGVD